MIEVVAGLIYRNGRFLICQRRTGEWEFAGGKVEMGERLQTALERELMEELCIQVRASSVLASVEHEYPGKRIHLTLLKAELLSGEVTLTEHLAYEWITSSQLKDFAFSPADARLLEDFTPEEDADAKEMG